MINKHKSNKIKENSNTVRHLNNGTDHRHSKSCCDQSSPARRTIISTQLPVITCIFITSHSRDTVQWLKFSCIQDQMKGIVYSSRYPLIISCRTDTKSFNRCVASSVSVVYEIKSIQFTKKKATFCFHPIFRNTLLDSLWTICPTGIRYQLCSSNFLRYLYEISALLAPTFVG